MNNTTSSRKRAVKITLAGRTIGTLRGSTFYRTLKPNHYLQRPPGIALDAGILAQLERLGCERLEFMDAATGATHTASLSQFLEKGWHINRGWGEQIALGFDAFSHRWPASAGAQLPLFPNAK